MEWAAKDTTYSEHKDALEAAKKGILESVKKHPRRRENG
jgi:hypothetical protein